MSKFKEGDKVRVVLGPWKDRCSGFTGTLLEKWKDYALYDFGSVFKGHGNTGHWYVCDEDVELVTDTWTPKVGDKVRVTTKRHGDYQYGREGVVSTISVTHLPILVDVSIGRFAYSADDLELVVDKPAFEVGQRAWYDDELITIEDLMARINFGSGGEGIVGFSSLRPATAAELAEHDEKAALADTIKRLKAHVTDPKYKIGEAVIIDDDDLVNKTGVVSGHLGYGMYNVAVVCDDDEIDDLEYEARFLKRAA